MKKFFLTTIALICLCQLSTQAQNADQKWGAGFNAGLRDYKGDLGNGFFKFAQNDITVGGWVYRYLNPSIDLGVNLNYGGLRYRNTSQKDSIEINDTLKRPLFDRSIRGSMFDFSVVAKYKFNNGYILKENSILAPYVFTGIGIVRTSNIESSFKDNLESNPAKKLDNVLALNIPLGIGAKLKLEENVSLVGQISRNFSFTDDFDGLDVKGNDGFLQYNLGFIVNFGKPKDLDKDGIADKVDKCLDTRAGVKVTPEGCDLDTDGDGIADFDDTCPEVAGKIKGCPDKDNDGIADKDDKCPEQTGVEAFGGCPDSDSDGIQDSEDKCPNLAGIAQYGGCPDTDGDGIIDPSDDCPQVAGTIKGCPDTDSDGIADKEDKCPKVAGIAANKGCPEIKEEVMAKVLKSAKGVFFETGKDKLKNESFKNLNELAIILMEDEAINVEIQGHTDNKGDATKNKDLSQKRADAVKNFLIVKGIDSSRLKAIGYGSELPIADNATEKGRASNRRVEFKLSF